jgi:hypothetical protein
MPCGRNGGVCRGCTPLPETLCKAALAAVEVSQSCTLLPGKARLLCKAVSAATNVAIPGDVMSAAIDAGAVLVCTTLAD